MFDGPFSDGITTVAWSVVVLASKSTMSCLCSTAVLTWTLRICKSSVEDVTLPRPEKRINAVGRKEKHGESWWKINKLDLWIYGIMDTQQFIY